MIAPASGLGHSLLSHPPRRSLSAKPAASREAADTLTLESFIQELAAGVSGAATRNRAIAANHLARLLGRAPLVADLADDAITQTLAALQLAGRSDGTLKKVRDDLLRLARLAAARGLLEYEPLVDVILRTTPARRPNAGPWSIDELNRMLASARTMPDTVGQIPAAHWYPAFLLVLLDSGASASDTLAAPFRAYDRHAGTLALGCAVYALHPLTIEALELIAGPGQGQTRDRLFPWTLDGGKPPYHMLYRQYRWLLWRASLAHTSANLFHRLQTTARALPDVLGQLDLQIPFQARAGRLVLPRAKTRRNAARRAKGEPSLRRAATIPGATLIVPLNTPSEARDLRRWFDDFYRPRRLLRASARTVDSYRSAINSFAKFAGFAPTLDQLNEARIETYLAWLGSRGAAVATINKKCRELLALANYAYRKRYLADEVRGVETLREEKKLAQCWTLPEFGKLLSAAANAPGDVSGIPAGTWWPALLLLLFYTGLRLHAALTLRSSDLDPPFILARAECQKQKADQLFKLHEETLALLAPTRPAERELLLPTPHGPNKLRGVLRSILTAAGLPSTRRDLFHKVRRTSATYLAAAAGKTAAQEHLGHSDASVTARYVDLRMMPRLNAVDVLPRPTWRNEA